MTFLLHFLDSFHPRTKKERKPKLPSLFHAYFLFDDVFRKLLIHQLLIVGIRNEFQRQIDVACMAGFLPQVLDKFSCWIYNEEFVGRIAIGRIERGTVKQNQEIAVCNFHQPDAAPQKAKATALYQFDGLGRVPVTEATAGNIIAMSGIGEITIGDTICAPDAVEPIEFVKISAPTIEMTFSVNDSPFAGKEGKFVTSRQIRERLFRETMKDVSLRVTETDSTDAFNVAGRGEMSLSILIETMRREGYEFQVSPPRVLYQEIDGKMCEPVERLGTQFGLFKVGICQKY